MASMSTTKKVGLAVASSALVIGAGVGMAGVAFAEPTPGTPSSSATTSPSGAPTGAPTDGTEQGGPGERGPKGDRGPGGGLPGASAEALAEKLGISEDTVTEAVTTVREAQREAGKDTDQTPEEREAAMTTALAKELGVSEEKLTTALEELRSEHQAEEKAALKERLDQAVTDGKLTQAEADAVAKAAEAGVIGYGPHGPR